MLPKIDTKAIAKADCFCLRPIKDLVDNKFLTFLLSDFSIYQKLSNQIHGATRPRINTTQLKELQIPVPPLEEQKEIVKRVEKLLNLQIK